MGVLRGRALIDHLDSQLAEYAVKNAWALEEESRIHDEQPLQDDPRTPFQHDRDRIIHSRAFRRLRGKTQVFMATRGDHFRTRLSHTLEVAQLSRSIARVFRLNEDLTEAIALGHDLGHPPFGHSGEQALHRILSGQGSEFVKVDVGGFKHNLNSLKMVDFFEKYFPNFPGLNLTHWTREGILKHTGLTYEDCRRVQDETLDLNRLHIETDVPTCLEGQVVALCDEIAQVTHDLEDAFRAGILDVEAENICRIPIYAEAKESLAKELNPDIARRRLIRDLINKLVLDVIEETERRLTTLPMVTVAKGTITSWVVAFTSEKEKEVKQLKDILNEAVYASNEISRMDVKGEMIIERLFDAYVSKPERLPDYIYRTYNSIMERMPGKSFSELKRHDVPKRVHELQHDRVFLRVVAEHIAGMTDNYAIQEYRDLFIPKIEPIR